MKYVLVSIPDKDKLFYKKLFGKLKLKFTFVGNVTDKVLKKRSKDPESGKVVGRSREEVKKNAKLLLKK